MRTILRSINCHRNLHVLAMLLAVSTHLPGLAQGTAFTYQGRLTDNASPANGLYDLTFQLFDAASGGGSQGGPLTNINVSLSAGLFTVTLDFGMNPFSSGAPRWLEIGTRTNGAGPFMILSPRQAVTPAPYAITAANLSGVVPGAALSGTYSGAVIFNNASNQFVGSVAGNGSGLSNVNAATVGGLASSNFWQLGGNSVSPAQFIGTSNNQALELHVNGIRALRLEPTPNDTHYINFVNVIGGSPANTVSSGVHGATIAGGGGASYFFNFASNSVTGDFGTIGGGLQNVSGASATAAGGELNYSIGSYSTIGGGLDNTASDVATVAGGNLNFGGGVFSSVGGGQNNSATGSFASVPGGYLNLAGGQYSFAAGTQAKALHDGTFVWADSISGNFSSTASNQFLIRAAGGVGIGKTNPATALDVLGTVTATTISTAGGSAGGVAYGFQGDTDTGLFHPIVNAVALATGGSERLRINSGGNVGIGTASPATALHVRDSVDAEISIESSDTGGHRWTIQSTSVGVDVNRDGSFQIVDRTLNDSRLLIGTNGNVGIGTVAPAGKLHVSGTAGNNTGVWSNFSDRRLKDHIKPMAAGSLDQLLRLEGVTYDYTRPELREGYDGVRRGWIAQQVEQVFPEWVSEAPDGMKMVTPVGFNALTVEALRELRAEKDTALQTLNHKLEDQLNAQKAELRAKDHRITELEGRLATLEQLVQRTIRKGD